MMRIRTATRKTLAWSALGGLATLAVLLGSATFFDGEPGAAADEGRASSSEMAEHLVTAGTSPEQEQVLADGIVTEAEMTAVEESTESCLKAAGAKQVTFPPTGGVTWSGPEDADDELLGCIKEHYEDVHRAHVAQEWPTDDEVARFWVLRDACTTEAGFPEIAGEITWDLSREYGSDSPELEAAVLCHDSAYKGVFDQD